MTHLINAKGVQPFHRISRSGGRRVPSCHFVSACLVLLAREDAAKKGRAALAGMALAFGIRPEELRVNEGHPQMPLL